MKVLVLVKRVPAPGAKINITPDEQAVDTKNLGFAMSPHEECGVELAVQLVEAHGGESTVMTLGGQEAEEQLRYAVSLGVDNAVLVQADTDDWDPMATAAALAGAITEAEAGEPFDLIIFGNESADSGGYQVGIRAAHALGRPIVSGIKAIETDGDQIRARRQTVAGLEEYRLTMPAIVAVKEGITLPRYPTMKGRLNARKADVKASSQPHTPGGQKKIRLIPAPETVSNTVVLGEGVESAGKIVDLLVELGVLT
ncbi:MAG: electron transfer flavoprotein subunit beta/FixA family protein [Acidimicrobiia bacterium]|nr:electron transfer flavoprotein subunit beta/FixA family protein [Acidimicrobiia bacterium]MDH5503206.1 electron transfer flavoprotein subunit beta/FixA family protein [Acidimicrobiia bacterium]